MTTEKKVENWGMAPVVLCAVCGQPVKTKADGKPWPLPGLNLVAHKEC